MDVGQTASVLFLGSLANDWAMEAHIYEYI